MRRWGIVLTTFYALIVVFLLLPGAYLISGESWRSVVELYREWMTWIVVGILIAGQGLLLFLSVDTSRKRLKPRQHVFVSISVAALLFGLLTFAVIWSFLAGAFGDEIFEEAFVPFSDNRAKILGWWLGLWLIWGFFFYLYFRETSKPVTRAIAWLLRGSVLELLVAVPSHILVRHREDCSAPMVTGLGIATGIAIMLLSFGPSVLFLYKRRLDAYSRRKATTR